MFDHWDHELQTGNDTEYALVLLALCIGAACSLARLIVIVTRGFSFRAFLFLALCVQHFVSSLISFSVSPPGSPPLTLRI
jgi:hypothetical protein